MCSAHVDIPLINKSTIAVKKGQRHVKTHNFSINIKLMVLWKNKILPIQEDEGVSER
jgi:hypothetical protein